MCDSLKAGTDPTTDNKKANSEELKFTILTLKMRFRVSSSSICNSHTAINYFQNESYRYVGIHMNCNKSKQSTIRKKNISMVSKNDH